MGSKFRSAIISENVRHSLSKWKKRVREKHGRFLRESHSNSSLDSMATDTTKGHGHGKRGPTEKGAASPSQQQEGSFAMQEPSPPSSSSHKGKLKLKSPQLNFSLEECSPNSDDTNHDHFDVEDEIHCIEPWPLWPMENKRNKIFQRAFGTCLNSLANGWVQYNYIKGVKSIRFMILSRLAYGSASNIS